MCSAYYLKKIVFYGSVIGWQLEQNRVKPETIIFWFDTLKKNDTVLSLLDAIVFVLTSSWLTYVTSKTL